MKLSRVLLLAGMLAVQFAVFETGLRLAGGSEAAPEFQRLFTDDARIGYRLAPGAASVFKTPEFQTSIAINSSGVRDDEVGPKAADERRIVFLGDSLVMSIQVELGQTFTRLLEARLNANPLLRPWRYRVINAGVQGYGPVEELLFYEEVARALRPDIVLVGVFVGNDATEALASAPKLSPVRATADIAQEEAAQRLRRIVRRSMVLQIVRLRVNTLLDRFRQGEDISGPLTAYLSEPPPEVARGLDVTRACLADLAKRAKADGAAAGLVLFPARFQTDDGDFARLSAIVAASGATLVRDAASARFHDALGGLGLPMMDALDTLRTAPRRQELFFQQTVHLTPRGHQVVAEALERFLLDSGLVDRVQVPAATGRRRGPRRAMIDEDPSFVAGFMTTDDSEAGATPPVSRGTTL